MVDSPFARTESRPGQGEIHLRLLPPNFPSFEILNFTYPLKLVTSTPHKLNGAPVAAKEDPEHDDKTQKSRNDAQPLRPANVPLLFMLSYGGGLLPPDSIYLRVTLDQGTRLTLTTQGSTKIFPSSSSTIKSSFNPESPPVPAVATQTLLANLSSYAALLLAPDPIQPFARSHYIQKQIFTLAPTASLCLLDWVIEGRRARGEVWEAGSWRGRNEIWREFQSVAIVNGGSHVGDDGGREKVLMLRDAVFLDGGVNGAGQTSLRKEATGVFGTIILAGPLFAKLAAFFLEEFKALPRIGGRKWGDEDDDLGSSSEDEKMLYSWRAARVQHENDDKLLWTVADVRGSIVVKFTARELEGAKRWIESIWRFEGTIATEFGDGGFMCLR